MAQPEYKHASTNGLPGTRTIQNQPTNIASLMSSEDDLLADVDEPPDLERTPRPSGLKLHQAFKASFSKSRPTGSERKESLLTHALHSDSNSNSNSNSPTEEHVGNTKSHRGLSSASTWSSHSASTAELTSDGGLTSPGTRANTPSPPLPPATFHNMVPVFNSKPFEQPLSIVRHDDDHVGPLQKAPAPRSDSSEHDVEATLGRKRCITFACGNKDVSKPAPAPAPEQKTSEPPRKGCTIKFACGKVDSPKPAAVAASENSNSEPKQPSEPPKRNCTIKFACPTKISTDALNKDQKPRLGRAMSPAPVRRERQPSKGPKKSHRDSNSTVRNASPVSSRKSPAARNRTRRLSGNSDIAHTEAFRFHEFASSEEEIEEWTQESTCHRSRLTITDTLRIENSLRQLGQEVEEEALDDESDDLDDDDDVDLDDDDLDEDEDEDDDSEDEISSDEGFQTDDEEGFAVSDDDSDAGSDFNWWAPGASTAATSVEHLEQIRPNARRTMSESSTGSDSDEGFKMPERPARRKKSRPVNIRAPSPELPDSTDFVCGTLDEDRPLEAAYMSCLERRRAAKHKITPQDIDPTFPTSDPEMDEEDEDDEPDNIVSESDQHVMMHGSMDHLDGETRGRKTHGARKRSPLPSPRRLRSPPPVKRVVHRSPPPTKRAVHRSPPAKRAVHRSPPPAIKRTAHRSPPPRKLFGTSPKRTRSPAPGVRLRSPPPTRRGSAILSPRNPGLHISFGGLAGRPAPVMASSVPRTPMSALPPDDDDLDGDETCREMPVRRAIDIKIGLENKRLRRKEQLYKKLHRKGAKDKEKRPAPGKGCERMREMGLGLAAHKGKTTVGVGFGMGMPPTPDQKDMHVLSI